MAPPLLTGLFLRVLSVSLVPLVVALLALIAPAAAFAQTGHRVADAAGIKENRTYLSELPGEHIDTMSGGLVLSFTDLVLPGNAGRDLHFQRTYNSKDESGRPHWTFGLAGTVMEIADPDGPFDAPTQNNFLPRFSTSDGAEHRSAWLDQLNFTNSTTLHESSRWVITARFWRYDRIDRRLYLPDGLFCDYQPVPDNWPSGTMLKVADCEDLFGNVVTFEYDAQHRLSRVAQMLGGQTREVLFGYDGAPDTMPRYMEFLSRRWNYAYEPGFRSPNLITVAPPVGPGWSYDYESESPDELTSMTTPRGGIVAYDYGTHEFGRLQDAAGQTVVPSRVLTSRSVSGRDLAPGTWTYTYENAGLYEVTTVQSPSGTRTRYEHNAVGLVAYTPTVGSEWGVIRRITTEPHGSSYAEVEREDFEFTALPVGTQSRTATHHYTLAKRTLKRGNRTYVTQHTFRSTDFADYHRAWTTTETGENVRVTTRTYFYGFNAMPTRTEPRILGSIASESVTVGTETFTKSWEYAPATGFMTKAITYGRDMIYAPDSYGNVATATDAKGHTTTFGYSWGVNSTITPPIASVALTRVINPDGTIASETQGGRTTAYEYDVLNRQTKETPPAGAFTTTSYDNTGGAWMQETRGTTFTRTTLDGFGKPIRVENAAGVKTDSQYDAEGRLIADSLPYTSEPQRRWSGSVYDALGRLTRRTLPDGLTIERTYDGSDITIKDENGRITRQLYQSFGDPNEGRLTRLIDADSKSWHYTYNAVGKLTTVTAPDLSNNTKRVFTYNTKNELTSEKHPESGTTTYTYDAAGNRETKTNAAGVTLTYTYDNNDRLAQITSGAHLTTFGYEPGSNLRTTASNNFATSTFSYDTGGRLQTRSDAFESQTFSTSYTYDTLDNLDMLTYASGRVIQYGYDAANRITSITDITPGSTPKTYASGFTYHASGTPSSYVSGNGVLTTIDLDPSRLWPTRIEADVPGSQPDLRIEYGYDGVGNVTSLTEPVHGSYSQTFQYDRLDRMTRATGTYGVIAYTYDAHGSQLFPLRTYDSNTLRLTSHSQGSLYPTSTLSYDGAGRLTTTTQSGNAWINTYNVHGMMSAYTINSTNVSQYDYDADDLRKIRRTDLNVTPLRTYYVHGPGGQLLSDFQKLGTGAMESNRDYIYAGSRLIAAVKPKLMTPYVEWTTVALTMNENAGSYTPRVRLRVPAGGPIAAQLRVFFMRGGGTAAEGYDYYGNTGGGYFVTFPAGSVDGAELNMAPITIVVDGMDDEDEETATFVLHSVTGGRIGSKSRQVLTIVDIDPPPFLDLNWDATAQEGATVQFMVAPSTRSSRNIYVDWYLSDPSSGCAPSIGGTIMIPATAFNEYFTFRVPINGRANQGNRQLQVHLANARGGIIRDGLAVLTVQDMDTAVTLDLTKPGHYLANVRSGGTDRVTLGNPYGVDVPITLTYFLADGGVLRQTRTLPARRRETLDMTAVFGTCQAGASLAVQVPTAAQLVSVEHAGSWGDTGSRASEGVQPASAWHFAEGTTADGQETITVLNPNNAAVLAKLELFGHAGALSVHTQTVPALSRFTWNVNTLLPNAGHGAIVSATITGKPAVIVADRTVTWNDNSEGYSTSGIATPQYQAHLAGGEIGPEVKTTLSLMSLSNNDTNITVDYIHEDGTTYQKLLTLVARHRFAVEPPLWVPPGKFGYRITPDPAEPFVAERTIHALPNPRGASAAVAVAQPSAIRAFAEGTTGEADTIFWVLNPATVPATVVFEFYGTEGTRLARHSVTVPAGSRRDVVVNEIEGMAWQSEFQTIVMSAIPVVTERATYWPGALNGIPSPEVPIRASAHVSNGWEISAFFTGPLVFFDTPSSLVSENNGPAAPMLRVTTPLATPLDAPVTVTFKTTGGAGEPGAGPNPAMPYDDYTPQTGTVTFPAGWTSGDGKLIDPVIPIVNDQTDEGDETFKVAIAEVTGGTARYSDAHQVTIVDDEPGETVFIDDGTAPENGGYIDIRIWLSRPSNKTISIPWTTRNGTALGGVHYGWRTGIAVIRPGFRWVWIRIPLYNDNLPPYGGSGPGCCTRVFYIDLGAPGNGGLDRPGGVVIIEDDEPPTGGGGTPPPIDPTQPGAFFADATARPGVLDYVLISNPNAVPVVAHLTYVRPDGSTGAEDYELQPQQRTTVEVRNLPDMEEEDVSLAIQSSNPAYAIDADHSVYWGPGLQVGRSTEGVMPNPEWYFAEGTTGGSFKETITIFNPSGSPVDVLMEFLLPSGVVLMHPVQITGPGRVKVDINDVLGQLAGTQTEHATRLSAKFANDDPAPIVAERTMTWGDPEDIEAHSTPGAPAPSTTWYFAEGETGAATFIALGNPNSFAVTSEVTYLHENGTPYTQTMPIAALSRVTIQPPVTMPAGSFGMKVTTPEDHPIFAERMMYRGIDWTEGSAGVGSPVTSTVWRFSEGATGFWATYMLLANPSATASEVRLTFYKDNGTSIVHDIVVPAGARRDVGVHTLPGLEGAIFRTVVESTNNVPIVAERSMYWSLLDTTFSGSHVTMGRPQ